jgi:hypothetical protein
MHLFFSHTRDGVSSTSHRPGYLVGLLAALILAAAWLSAPYASAGTIAITSCKTPVGNPAPVEGWEEGWTGNPYPWAGDGNECASGGPLSSFVGDEIPQPGSSGPYWEYIPPAGDKIVGGQVSGTFSVPGGIDNYDGAAGLLGPKLLFDGADVIGGDPGGIAGTFEGTYSLTNHTGGNLWIYAFCEPPGATCPAGDSFQNYWASAAIHSAIIELSNNSTPAGASFTGPISGTAPVSGTQSLSFQASDPGGSGIYQVAVSIDSKVVYDSTPDTNGGACVPLGTYQGASEFIDAQPCKRTESVSIPLSTASLEDGAHELQVTVIDAAGNQSIVYDGTLTTNNAPLVTSPPSISGSAQVGSTLAATNAVFTARTGLGPLGPVSGQWLRCSGTGTGCSAIAAADGSNYTLVAADHGYTIEYESTVQDAYKHTAHAASAPTVAVAEVPAASGSCAGSCQGASGGSGGSGAPGGSGGSVVVNVPGSGLNQGSVVLGSSARWRVLLRVSPRRVRRGLLIRLSGVVVSSPRPASGKLVYLRARSVGVRRRGARRMRVFGKWVTFQAFRARGDGSFVSSYRFRLGGRHVYQFQAVAPAEGQYRNPTGTSNAITVKEN